MQAVLLGKEVDSAVETGKEPGKVIEMNTRRLVLEKTVFLHGRVR